MTASSLGHMRFAVVAHRLDTVGDLVSADITPTGFASLGEAMRYAAHQPPTSANVWIIVRFLAAPGEVVLEDACHSGLMSCYLPFDVVSRAFRRWAAMYCVTNTPLRSADDDEIIDLKETHDDN